MSIPTIVTVLFKPAEVMKTSANSATYDHEWVNKLYRGCRRNTTRDFRFLCLTDFPNEGFDEGIELAEFAWKPHMGTWMCINEVFRPDHNIHYGVLFDLDTVICKNIDSLFDYEGDFCMVQHPDHEDRKLKPLVIFRGETALAVWSAYRANPRKAVEDSKYRHWAKKQGSELLWWQLLFPNCDTVEESIPSLKVVSHKLRHDQIQDADIIYWHGSKKPHQCNEDEVTKNWI